MPIINPGGGSGGGGGTGEANTASNKNTAGVGVYKQKTGVDLEFRGINSASSKVSIALDAVNNEIDLDVVEANFSIPTAAIQLNAVGNARMAKMPGLTVKGNATGLLGDPQDMTLAGGLTTDGVSVLKSKGSFGFGYTFSTATFSADPGPEGIKFNSGTLASVTQINMDPVSAGGRNIGTYAQTFVGGQLGFIANNSTGTTAYGAFTLEAVADNAGNYLTFDVTPIAGVGVMPANGEEIIICFWPGATGLTQQDVLDMKVVRTNPSGQLIDEFGVIISGTPSVADQAALLALDPVPFDGFVVNIQSGLNNGFYASNGTKFGPLNGQLVYYNRNIPSDWVIFPDNVTWTAADNGSGKVRLTSSAVHNMTEANAEGSYLYLISGGTGWTAGTKHRITPATGYIDATHVDLDTNYTVGMGVPVFARAGTLESVAEAPLDDISLPILGTNSTVELFFKLEWSTDVSTNPRRGKVWLDTTELTNSNVAATNTMLVEYRSGFCNQANAAIQHGMSAYNGTGYNNATLAPIDSTVDTSVAGKVLSIRCMPNVPGIRCRVGSAKVLLGGA